MAIASLSQNQQPSLVAPDAHASVQVYDMQQLPWKATTNSGLWTKPLREDRERGLFLGLVKFAAFTRSGLHQHQGVATSFVIAGGLSDYHGSIGLHEAGINQRGSTHDAIAYQDTVLVSRLEGPVTYPVGSDISGVHTGSRYADFVNPNPEIAPEINVPLDDLSSVDTGVAGVKRQTIFDYQGTGSHHRMCQLSLRPQTSFSFETSALTEFWVRGGELLINDQIAHANCFVLCAADTKLRIESPFGALLIVWAEGPEKAQTQSNPSQLFGF